MNIKRRGLRWCRRDKQRRRGFDYSNPLEHSIIDMIEILERFEWMAQADGGESIGMGLE